MVDQFPRTRFFFDSFRSCFCHIHLNLAHAIRDIKALPLATRVDVDRHWLDEVDVNEVNKLLFVCAWVQLFE